MGIEGNNSIENMKAVRQEQAGQCGGPMSSYEIAALNMGFPPSDTVMISGEASGLSPIALAAAQLSNEGSKTDLAFKESFGGAASQPSDASIASLVGSPALDPTRSV